MNKYLVSFLAGVQLLAYVGTLIYVLFFLSFKTVVTKTTVNGQTNTDVVVCFNTRTCPIEDKDTNSK